MEDRKNSSHLAEARHEGRCLVVSLPPLFYQIKKVFLQSRARTTDQRSEFPSELLLPLLCLIQQSLIPTFRNKVMPLSEMRKIIKTLSLPGVPYRLYVSGRKIMIIIIIPRLFVNSESI